MPFETGDGDPATMVTAFIDWTLSCDLKNKKNNIKWWVSQVQHDTTAEVEHWIDRTNKILIYVQFWTWSKMIPKPNFASAVMVHITT